MSSPMGTTDLRGISHPLGCSKNARSGVSKNPESVPPERHARMAGVCAADFANAGKAIQGAPVSQTGEQRFSPADTERSHEGRCGWRCAYSSFFTWVRQDLL